MQADIQIKNITKFSKGLSDINGINLDIKTGDVIGIIGPEGSGKTSLIRLLTTYHTPDSGDILINNKSIYQNIEEYKSNLGYLPKTNPLYDNMTVVGFLELMAQMCNVPKFLRATRVIDIIRICKLNAVKNNIIGDLSKGAKRRVGIAQSIINNPSILLLDRPTSELDPNQAKKIRLLLQDLFKGRTVILCSQSIEDITELCTRIIYLRKGEIIADINRDDMLDENDENSIIKLQIAPVSQQRAIKEINTIENIDRAEVIDDYIYIYSKKDKHVEQDIFDICCQNEWYIRSLIPVELTIEEIIKKHLIN